MSKSELYWLVVLNIFYFPYGNVIIPTDELIFFRGVGIPPTSITSPGVGRSVTSFFSSWRWDLKVPAALSEMMRIPDFLWKPFREWLDFSTSALVSRKDMTITQNRLDDNTFSLFKHFKWCFTKTHLLIFAAYIRRRSPWPSLMALRVEQQAPEDVYNICFDIDHLHSYTAWD